ncbi:MAG: phosphoribosylaminoimidazolesuccinocarboxamide synthase [Woeseiaceae bacterium]
MTAIDRVFESSIPALTRVARGKVRDIYAVDDAHLAIVATDRLSAFDVVLPDPIPGKGIVLTQLSRFWFDFFAASVPNHMTDLKLTDVAGDTAENRGLESRTMIVRRLEPLPMEAVARGYLIGSGWKDYQTDGTVCGHRLPENLQLAESLASPIFTPATKAEVGDHDENVSFEQLTTIIGADRAETVRGLTLSIYQAGAQYAAQRGIIIADTKLEFGVDDHGQIFLIDEVLTPDSSRFWPQDQYTMGTSPPSFDKQYVRDYLETLDWDKTAPGPVVPDDVLSRAAEKYQQAFQLLTSPRT